MLKNVLKRFSIISGLKGEDFSKWSYLCTDSLNYVLRHTVKENLSTLDEERLCSLSAALAFYKLALYDFDDVTSFTAGDLQINKCNIQNRAEKIMQSEMLSCTDITDLGGVCFFGVKS